MRKILRIAVVGSGAGAFGVLNGLKLNPNNALKIDHYVPAKYPAVRLLSGSHDVTLPLSTPYGSMGLWGGILAFSSLEDYREFSLWPLLGCEAQDPEGLVTDKILRSCDPKKVLAAFKLLRARLEERVAYASIKNGISRVEKTKSGLQLYSLNGEKIKSGYDKVVLCAGAVHTPRILALSGYIDCKVQLFDNSMKIITPPGSDNLQGIYDYSSKEPQYVSTVSNGDVHSHYVRVKKYFRFNSSDAFAKAYWHASGKSLMNKAFTGLSVVFPSILNRKVSISPNLLDNLFCVQSCAATKIELEINKKTTKIIRKSIDSSTVSAFHLHGSVAEKVEAALKEDNIFIADASVTRNVNGLNPFAEIFSKATSKVAEIVN